jgi:hypothetical protein
LRKEPPLEVGEKLVLGSVGADSVDGLRKLEATPILAL